MCLSWRRSSPNVSGTWGIRWAFLMDVEKPEAGPHASHELLAGPRAGGKHLQNVACMLLCFKHRVVQDRIINR